MQSIPPTTADKQTQAQKRRGSRSRKLLGAKAKSYTECIYLFGVPLGPYPYALALAKKMVSER